MGKPYSTKTLKRFSIWYLCNLFGKLLTNLTVLHTIFWNDDYVTIFLKKRFANRTWPFRWKRILRTFYQPQKTKRGVVVRFKAGSRATYRVIHCVYVAILHVYCIVRNRDVEYFCKSYNIGVLVAQKWCTWLYLICK